MIKENVRLYGEAPFDIAVVHGGPGAAGEMATVARVLSEKFGVMEPLQTKKSVNEQIEELNSQIKQYGTIPITLIGYSWGAWLVFMYASEYPKAVKKLILISAPAFEGKYNINILNERLRRLSKHERAQAEKLQLSIMDPENANINEDFKQYGKLISKADSYKPINEDSLELIYDPVIHQLVWNEASSLRTSGNLLKYAKNIKCKITAIHGTYDPHPVDGVIKPLSKIINNFKMIKLEKCGHTPWHEKYAKDKFFEVLENEINVI